MLVALGLSVEIGGFLLGNWRFFGLDAALNRIVKGFLEDDGGVCEG